MNGEREIAHVIKFLDDITLRSERRIERHHSVEDDAYSKGFSDGTELVLDNIKFIRKWLADILEEL